MANGKAAIEKNRELFTAVGKETGVDPYLLGAIWGIETNYGAVLDNPKYIRPIIRSLATLVHQRRVRLTGDEADFIAALLLLQRNHMQPDELVGSWAGAIGHLQVESVQRDRAWPRWRRRRPHRSQQVAVRRAGDKREISPRPGLSARARLGFRGRRCPPGSTISLATRTEMRPVSFFAERGVKRVGGRSFDDLTTPVFLYAPAGQNGPKFLMTGNYLVLKGYNQSDNYALSITHLTDRLKGGSAYVASWPRNTKFPDLAQRKAIQQALLDLGHYEGKVDGLIGPISQAAYARFQASRGEVADGFITLDSYEKLTAATR